MKLTEILVTLSLYVPLIVVFVICIALEIFLANRQSRWPGLVLPICWLMPAWLVLPNLLLNALSLAENAGQMRSCCWRFTGFAADAGKAGNR